MKSNLLTVFIITWVLIIPPFIFTTSPALTLFYIVAVIGLLGMQIYTYKNIRPIVNAAPPEEEVIIYHYSVKPLPGSHIVWYDENSAGTVNHTFIDNWELFCEVKGVKGWQYYKPILKQLKRMDG